MQYLLSLLIDTPDQNLQVINLFWGNGIMIFRRSIRETNNFVMLLIDNGPLAIDAGRHPILESIHHDFVVCYAFVFKNLMALVKLFLYRNLYDLSYLISCILGRITSLFLQPNNIFLSEASNMVIVMGPNM